MPNEPVPNAPPPSPEECQHALRAFKKRLKLARLDEESTIGSRATSGGKKSGIVAVKPPNQFPQAVWDELVRQGKLKYLGQGLYEIAGP
ncbi:MAG: hypothetical protein MUC63_06460 [Planctomycetes bacterium]|jgi:hypothetical protein|nr:hypothetical protein [Planctomycetota bacterium]